jgi:hypothetical protein
MASKSSTPSKMNSQPAHGEQERQGSDERWKTRPSTETTHDEGDDAERARRVKREENDPGRPRGP